MKNQNKLIKYAFLLILVYALLLMLILCGCTRVIRNAADEITLSDWSAVLEGGAQVSLSFEGDKAAFSVDNAGKSSVVDGICILSPDEIVICDEERGENYCFAYILHGDHLELSYNNSVIILEKG